MNIRSKPRLAALLVIALAIMREPMAEPANELPDAGRLVPYDNAFLVTIYKKDVSQSQTIGIWSDQLRLRLVNGREVAVRTQSIGYFDGRMLLDVNAFDAKTFEPVSDIQVKPDGTREQWSFDSKGVSGTVIEPSGRVDRQTYAFAQKTFDLNCCMRSLLPAMMALKKGKSFQIAAFDGTDGLTNVNFRVLGREQVRAGALGMVDAWLVETDLSDGYIHFWIYDRAPYLVRMTLSMNHLADYSQSFDMLESGAAHPPPPPPPPRSPEPSHAR